MSLPFAVCVAWYNPLQRAQFLKAWGLEEPLPPWLFLEQDVNRIGGAKMKNQIMSRVVRDGLAEVLVVVDDDCYPEPSEPYRTLEEFAWRHVRALEPQPVELCVLVSSPPSRGTPYFDRTVEMPVAASVGFWTHIGDYDAPSQLVRGATTPMAFFRKTLFGRYFAFCGMNFAARASWWPWFRLIENAPRFDDIWAGFIFQKYATHAGFCFNLNGPLVRHSRQSNVWGNLRDEVLNLEANETMWKRVHEAPNFEHSQLLEYLKLE
jgi:hypothetical protein